MTRIAKKVSRTSTIQATGSRAKSRVIREERDFWEVNLIFVLTVFQTRSLGKLLAGSHLSATLSPGWVR